MKVRPIVIGVALWLAACAPVAGPMPIQPFPDVPVPAQWTPYSNDWAIIRTPRVTAARLIYFTPASAAATVADARHLLAGAGWTEHRSEPFVNVENFPDICRVTVIEGSGATHVDDTIARVNPGA